MALKDILQQFLDDEQWQDEIAHDDRDDTDFISTGFQIDGQRYRLILIMAELPKTIRVVLISPLKIPKTRAREAAIVLSALNVRLPAALTSYQAEFAIAERLAKSDPGNAGWQRDRRISVEKIGGMAFLLVLAHDFAKALETADLAISYAPDLTWLTVDMVDLETKIVAERANQF